MGLITDLTPLNAAAERKKFLAQDNYNPQFEYVRSFSSEELHKYGQPHPAYFKHAQQMLADYGIPEGSKPLEKQTSDRQFCTKEEIEQVTTTLLTKLNLPSLAINFSHKLTSQVMIGKKSIRFRLPIKFTKESLVNKLNHEVQTHYLRRYNQSLQSWNLQTVKHQPRAFRTTEEGLANLHSYIDRPDHILRKTYLNYFAAYSANKLSFRELYDQLLELGVKETLAWNLTLKQKRGLKDTSKPGSGFPKNHVYFEGTVKVWDWLNNKNNDPHQLYWGRISLQDLPEVRKLSLNDEIIYPTFYDDMEAYRQFIAIIGEENQLDELPVLA